MPGTRTTPVKLTWTLHLTNPPMHGKDVEGIQRLLTEKGFPTAVDGVFGPDTAIRCIEAKRRLGYAKAEQLPIAGPRLVKVLPGARAVPAATRPGQVAMAAPKTPQSAAYERALGLAARERQERYALAYHVCCGEHKADGHHQECSKRPADSVPQVHPDQASLI